MTDQMQTSPSTFWQNLGRFFRALLRLLIFGLIVAIVTIVVYFAVPYIYRYAFLPVQNNRVLIERLQRSQNQLQTELTGQLADQAERLSQLETELAAERESRSQLEARLAQQAEMISAQATAQAELEAQLEAQAQTIATLEQSLDALDAFLTDLENSVTNLEQALASPETKVAELQRQMLIVQMNQALLRARLYLLENNQGQAQLTLRQARQILNQLEPLTPAEKQEDLADIQTRLEAVISAIEERPFIVTQELEILWQLLQQFAEDTIPPPQ